jgi:hypothetical protein
LKTSNAATGNREKLPVDALFVRTDAALEDDIVALVEKTVGAFGALQ